MRVCGAFSYTTSLRHYPRRRRQKSLRLEDSRLNKDITCFCLDLASGAAGIAYGLHDTQTPNEHEGEDVTTPC